MNKSVIIVAAGSGTRMGIPVPKQFLLLNDKPLLMHTIQRFYEYNEKIKIILVLPSGFIETWEDLLKKYSFSISHTYISGGKSRFDSVKRGIEKINEHCLVAIHDGVRPFCTANLISRCYEKAEKYSNAVPAIGITESVRETLNGKNFIVDREKLRIIQTPQCFDSVLLKKAYESKNAEKFTDDAGVFESDGNLIHLVEGEKNNIKITIPEDLMIASAIEKEFFFEKNRS